MIRIILTHTKAVFCYLILKKCQNQPQGNGNDACPIAVIFKYLYNQISSFCNKENLKEKFMSDEI